MLKELHNTEDKAWWVVHGATKEEEFVSLVAPQIGLKAEINPEKLKDDYAPDLVIDDDRKIADLKAQNTPFFTVGKTYRGYDPNYTVTFNKKDFDRYSELYPDIHILFWVKWLQTSMGKGINRIEVSPIYGVWRCTLQEICSFIHEGAPLHAYQRRGEDRDGNAKNSYLLDLRRMQCITEFDYTQVEIAEK